MVLVAVRQTHGDQHRRRAYCSKSIPHRGYTRAKQAVSVCGSADLCHFDKHFGVNKLWASSVSCQRSKALRRCRPPAAVGEQLEQLSLADIYTSGFSPEGQRSRCLLPGMDPRPLALQTSFPSSCTWIRGRRAATLR